MVEFDEAAAKELRKLDRQAQQEILRYFRERIATDEDPRRFGKPLSRDMAGLWRYRVRNYRVICHIEDDKLVVLVLRAGHRKVVYE
jgi:mRNA interferase RelE/StbE